MIMTQLIKYTIAFFFLMGSTLAAIAQDSFQKELFSTDTVLKYRSEINLSEEQVSKVKKIHSDHITKFNSLKWDLDAAQVVLKKQLALTVVNEVSSLKQMEKILDIEHQIKKLRLGMLIKVKNTLSQTQHNDLKKLRTDSDVNGISFTTSIAKNPRISIKGAVGSGGQEPLFVVFDSDGERQFNSKMSLKNINPDTIETVTILKGRSAEAKYGSEGKNGVVVITLKNK